jgi:hypothetical protein
LSRHVASLYDTCVAAAVVAATYETDSALRPLPAMVAGAKDMRPQDRPRVAAAYAGHQPSAARDATERVA